MQDQQIYEKLLKVLLSRGGRGTQLSTHPGYSMIAFSCSSPAQIIRHQVFHLGSEHCDSATVHRLASEQG